MQRLSMPKLLPQRLAVAVQVLRHVEMVFQTNGLQSLRQSVREGRNNVCGMREMLFQSEELQSMWHSVKDTNHFEAFEGRRRAALARGRRGTFWERILAYLSVFQRILACSSVSQHILASPSLS